MIKYLVAFLFLPLFGFAQNNLRIGIGVIKIDYQKLPILKFFTDNNQLKPIKTIIISKDSEGEYTFKNKNQVDSWFSPEQLSMDYDIFVIRVDTSIGRWYKVYVNNEKGNMLWIKADLTKKFIKWPHFLKNETTAIEKGAFELDIKTEPNENATTIKKIDIKDCFQVLDIKGDWMKIKTNTNLDCNESKKTIKSGWIKWKYNNKLAISYGLTC